MASSSVLKLRGGAHDSRTTDNVSAVLNPLAEAVGNTPIMGADPPAWIRPDLAGGYSQTAAPQPITAFHKDALGYVHAKIGLTHAAGCAAGTTAFTFPLDYRPSETLTLSLSDGAGLFVAMTVAATGAFANLAILAAATDVRGVFSFLAEQ